MREMKDSGIECIGEIPKDWIVIRLKYCFSGFTNGTSDTQLSSGESFYPVTRIETISSGEINLDKIGYVAFSKKQYLLKTGDILVSNINSIKYLGNCAIVRDGYKLYHGMNLLRIVPSDYIDNGYAYYLFKSNVLKFPMEKYCKPAINQASVSATTIKNFFIPFPALAEQQQIANFLDSKCSEIDATVEDIQKEISLLEEYKKSVITEAVTKGLNPDAEMKDSGIEWIGEIPKDWKVIRFKYIAIVKSNLVAPIRYMNYPQIAPDVIEKNTGKIISHRSVEEANVDSWNHLFYKGQILYSKIRPVLNKVVIAPYDGLCSADMYPISAKENVRFLQYIMLSAFFVKQVDLVTRDRIKMPKINQDELGNILLVWTSKEEQQQIADFLDSKCSEIDSLIADKKRQLDILADYKKSLIYEYVTGKKEVPVNE